MVTEQVEPCADPRDKPEDDAQGGRRRVNDEPRPASLPLVGRTVSRAEGDGEPVGVAGTGPPPALLRPAARGSKSPASPPGGGDHRPVPPRIQRYLFLKAVAHFEFAWEQCRRPSCRARKRCTGGPRGTCQTVGVPLCRRHAPAEWWKEMEGALAPPGASGRR